jgi:hypothetical protein
MDQFELFLAPLGTLVLRTNKGRRYEILFKDCTSADKVYCWLHAILHEHREDGKARYYYSTQDEGVAWRWIKKLNENAWIDTLSLGAIVKGVQNALSMRPLNRQVVEHEWVSLKLA